MSEIYLTKIERKTIFTKSLIFVLIVFIISDLTVTGPFYINFIPWIFILGVVGSVKKIDGVLMSIISTFTVFISSLIMQGEVNLSCLLTTTITLMSLVFGIFTGKFIYEFILQHRLVKYIPHSKRVTYIVLSVIMFVVSWGMLASNNGDILTYLKSRTNLKEYISTTYNVQEFSVKKAQYVRTVPGKYIYTVEIEGQKVYFVPISKDTFKDTGKDTRLIALQHAMEHEITDKVKQIQNKYTFMEDVKVRFNLEYNKVCIIPDTVVMNIEYSSDKHDIEKLDMLYEDMAKFIKEVQMVKQTQKVIITVNNSTLQISNENIQNLTSEYIKGGLDIEEIIE